MKMRITSLLCAAVLVGACTEAPPAGEDFTQPLDGLPPEALAAFLAGDEAFERAFTVAEGLGPRFNMTSCEGCHPADGRGPADTVVVKYGFDDPELERLGAPVWHQRAVPGAAPETLPDGLAWSGRLPPPVFGMGLIEAIPEAAIVGLEDPDDLDGDGISGRTHRVISPDFVPLAEIGAGPEPRVGRFGRKAAVASLLHQVADAYQQDMGITTDFLPHEHDRAWAVGIDAAGDPELPAAEVLAAVHYVRLLAPPARGAQTDAVRRGEQHFEALGCAGCHVPTLTTGPSPIAALDRVEVALYSDLLLHDMGPALDDGVPQGDADSAEWRTTPLWGLRLADDPLGAPAPLLHDGRTTDLTEAILLHGGEAQAARDAFDALTDDERRDVLAFLRSL